MGLAASGGGDDDDGDDEGDLYGTRGNPPNADTLFYRPLSLPYYARSISRKFRARCRTQRNFRRNRSVTTVIREHRQALGTAIGKQ